MKRYPLRMWHDSSGWIHVSSQWDEQQWASRGWVPEDVFRAAKAQQVSSPPESIRDADPLPAPAPAVPAVLVKRGRPRKVES